jgi:hypothetical protein
MGLAAVVCVNPLLGLRHLVPWSYVIGSKIPAADSPDTPAVISRVQRSVPDRLGVWRGFMIITLEFCAYLDTARLVR